MTPGNFRYDLILGIAFRAEYKIVKLAIFILDKMGDSDIAK